MKPLVEWVRARARRARARLVVETFSIHAETRILDLGSEDGSSIALVLRGTEVKPLNVFIADIDQRWVSAGQQRFGFTPVVIPESARLPFPDRFFDIVYCSSVIEHVTLPKSEVWNIVSTKTFRQTASTRQSAFAAEIRRLGKAYFVQTPNKTFPIESHTWLPLVAFLPRRVLLPFLRISNRYWIKATTPDWNLLSAGDMARLFPDAEIRRERWCGLAKSLMAIRRADVADGASASLRSLE